MPRYLIIRLLILGALAIFGIIFIQAYWVSKTWDIRDIEFDEKVHVVLREVAKSLSVYNKTTLPKKNFIQRKSSNYYAVNINSSINANVLEDILIRTFEEHSLNIDFEYAVFDCSNEQMVYGKYCKLEDDEKTYEHDESLAVIPDLTYYFVVKFPSRPGYLLSNMRTSLGFSIVALLAIIFFMYVIWVILRQKELNEMQKDFINNMTHEFKTPISSIKIASEVLLSNPQIKKDKRLTQYAAIINDQNQRLNSQVERVLNTAKMEKEGIKLKTTLISLNETLEDIVGIEKVRIHELKKGKIILNLPQEELWVSADKIHFTNVICSLIDNATHYCKRTPLITIDLKTVNNDIELSITDNGIGIRKEDISKLFQKFYRVSTGNVHDVKGFGLGLFYVKNIMQAHRWGIKVISDLGTSSTFLIKIPKKNT